MAYKTSFGFTDTQDNQKDFNEKFKSIDTGPYIGQVKYNVDPLRMGRLGVNIPALTKAENPKMDDIVWCQYLSPFAGAKPYKAVSSTDPFKQETNQHSYGMWAVPPDIDTSVVVIFTKGENKVESAFWIGCVQEPGTNQMIPGMGSNSNNSLSTEAAGDMGSGDPSQLYGTQQLPVTERNRKVQSGEKGAYDDFSSRKYPVNEDLADQLKKQGLIRDPVRGTTTSSATRESPSAVFGWSTPGRVRGDSRELNVGAQEAKTKTDRHHGHSFVMDDGEKGGSNQLLRMRTSSGHQILMHDSDQTIYISHASGNSYIEMDKEGKVDIYSGIGGINMRTEGDMNIHCDGNFNVHARNMIRMATEGEYVQSGKYLMNLGHNGVFTSAQEGGVRTYGKQGISMYGASTMIGARDSVHLAGSAVHLNSTFASAEWGPTWLTPEAATVNPRLENDVELTVKGSSGQVGILKPGTRKTRTTVHNFVHHEPRFRLSAFNSTTGPWNDSEYTTKARTPGTKEFIEQRNRESDIESIKLGQLQADALAYAKWKMGNSTNVQKASEALKLFSQDYNKTYNISNVLKTAAPFIPDSKKGALVQEVIDVVGDKDLQLFANQIFTNASGDVFTLKGSKISKNLSSMNNVIGDATNNLSAINKSIKGVTNDVYSTVDGVVDLENAASIFNDVSSLTQTYTMVKSGRITSVGQAKMLITSAGNTIKSLSSGISNIDFKNIGSKIKGFFS